MATGELELIGVDTGGTFTDFVYRSPDGTVRVRKLPSTPDDPSRVIREEFASRPKVAASVRMIHGTTVATNTLLERRGVRTALVTTRGFADVIEIGRQDRPQIYDLQWRPPAPLIPRELRFEVDERVAAGGEVITPLDDKAVRALLPKLREAGAEAVAVCFLFSPEYNVHEERAAALLQELDVPIVTSSSILPELREYERFSTATISSYVAPVMERYLSRLAVAIEGDQRQSDDVHSRGRLLVMASSGGARPWQELSSQAVQTVLSGPAGGVVAAAHYGERWSTGSGVVGFDMGGTSTDVSLVPRGQILHTRNFRVDGLPVAVPVVDVHTIGAGGGSEAWIDAGGALRVGPRSAGADPGPVCYGRGGTTPTVTDANVYLGRLPANLLLGGEMKLEEGGIENALRAIGEPLGLEPVAVACGIVRVVEAEMERALRRITQERGVDPRDLVLVPFGGAAGLHAVALARRLRMREVRIPPEPGVLSATGMLLAPIAESSAASVMTVCDAAGIEQLEQVASKLADDARLRITREWSAAGQSLEPQLHREVSVRYRGQSYELDVRWESNADPRHAFWEEYERRYGFVDRDRDVEVVMVRVTATLEPPMAAPTNIARASEVATTTSHTHVVANSETAMAIEAPIFIRSTLTPSDPIAGPAVIAEDSSTLWLPPGAVATLDGEGTLIVEPGTLHDPSTGSAS